MDVFQFSDYRAFFSSRCEDDAAPRGFRAALARAAGCQAAYLSQVLKGRMHFTEDQLVAAGSYLSLSNAEIDFLSLQLRLEKAGTPQLRTYLKASIRKAHEERSNLKNRVEADRTISDLEALTTYFTSWLPSVVHLLTSIEDFQTVDSLSHRLNIPSDKINEILEFLYSLRLVERSGSGWKFSSGSIHVPKDSPLQSSLQTTRRELAARSIAINSRESLHFSSLFTISSRDIDKLKTFAASMIESSHRLIKDSGSEELACICLDVFRVV